MGTNKEFIVGRRNLATPAIALIAALLLSSASLADAQSVAAATPSEISISPSTKRSFSRMSWAEAIQSHATPREICRMVVKNVRYRPDKKDQWARAEETWRRRFGDCEDFAMLIQDLAHMSGIPSTVYVYFAPTAGKAGHAVLVGQWKGKIWFSSNGSYEEVKSERDVLKRIAHMLSTTTDQLWVMKLSERGVAR